MIPPPLFENPDKSHCFQALLKSVLNRVFPERSYTYEELDKLSGKRPGCWTWPTTALLALKQMGLAVVLCEEFDYLAFAERGEIYLAEQLGSEVAAAQARHSDLAYERDMARRFAAEVPVEARAPGWTDLEELLAGGYSVICNVNLAVLNGWRGYAGHFVLVYEVGDTEVRFHDPGPPAKPGRTAPREKFLEAWAFPDARATNLMAFGPGSLPQETQ